MKLTIPLLIAVLSLASCGTEKQNDSTQTAKINEESKDSISTVAEEYPQLDIDPAVLFESFDCGKSQEINYPSGTTIRVPANAFVDKNGNPVKGKVDLEFTEMHTAGDIIASGISMKYDSAGVEYDFESAGMFEIRAYQKGAELALAQGQTIGVDLASFKDGSFNHYYMSDQTGEWEYLNNGKQIPNLSRSAKMDSINSALDVLEKPLAPVKYDPSGKYFDLNIDYKEFPDYKDLIGVLWQFNGDTSYINPNKEKKVFRQDWQYVSIQPIEDRPGSFEIFLENEDTSVTTAAVPVYRGAVLDAASTAFNEKLKSFNEAMNRKKDEMDRVKRESSILRSFQVANMGIYNCDRQYRFPNMVPLAATFDYGDEKYNNNSVTIFLITGNGNAVVQYHGPSCNFRYSPSEDNKMIAVLPDNKIATFGQSDFNRLSYIPSSSKPQEHTFKMKVSNKKIRSTKDLDSVIGSLL